MANKVKVVFPGGRTTWLDPKTADTKAVRRMGGRVVEAAPAPVVPKVYAKPITEPIVDPVADTEEEFAEVDFTAPAPKEESAPAKKPMGRPKKVKA